MKRIFLFLIFSSVMLGCNSLKTSFDFDESKDYSAYQTFALLRMNDQLRGAISRPAAVGRAIDRGLTEGFVSRGYVLDEDNADLHVTYILSVEELVADYEPLPYTARGSGAAVPIEVDRRGTFTIDIVDVSTNELIWRGTATDAVEKNNPKAEENIRNVVNKLLEKFPGR